MPPDPAASRARGLPCAHHPAVCPPPPRAPRWQVVPGCASPEPPHAHPHQIVGDYTYADDAHCYRCFLHASGLSLPMPTPEAPTAADGAGGEGDVNGAGGRLAADAPPPKPLRLLAPLSPAGWAEAFHPEEPFASPPGWPEAADALLAGGW